MTEHVLVIYPHPDDEGFSCSGTIAGYKKRNVPVTYICLTLGEMGRTMGKPIFANRESLREWRKKELQKAVSILGIDDLRMWGMWDKTVEFEDKNTLANRIKDSILEIKPTKIITFYPGFSVHPDHNACGAAVVEAVSRLPEEARPIVHCVAFSKDCVAVLGQPDIIIDVSSFLELKLKALKAHDSQFGEIVKQTEKLLELQDKETIERITKERFWTYSIK